MGETRVAISLDQTVLRQVDSLVRRRVFPNRSRIIQQAVVEKLARMERCRLAIECAKLNPKHEQALAEEGLSGEVREWPEY
ncbi:MAG: ribbon-helix-helix protein, CopG family [Planctomycetes bacterium]|nr:ribbon-helix-helix protein, CopG family [Planctomycetota bacterium]MBM4084859.1 ribbon-helix-helix protein, CopG family [Planctomycetota bacterium]